MLIYAVLKEKDQEEKAYLFDSYIDYSNLIENPDIDTICYIELSTLKGNSYEDKKNDLENKAIDFSNNQYPGLYMSDLILIQDYFETKGRQYGLLTEFKENCIC